MGAGQATTTVSVIGLNEVMTSVFNVCQISPVQDISNLHIEWVDSEIKGDVVISQDLEQTGASCAVTNAISILTSQVWNVDAESEANIKGILNMFDIDVTNTSVYETVENDITTSIKNKFQIDPSQTLQDIYISFKDVKVGGSVRIGQKMGQSNVSGAFNNVCEASASISSDIKAMATSGSAWTLFMWILLSIFIILAVGTVAYYIWKRTKCKPADFTCRRKKCGTDEACLADVSKAETEFKGKST